MAIPAITQGDVLALAPELSVLTAITMSDIVAYVNLVDLTQVGGNMPFSTGGEDPQTARIARIYLAAHIGTMARLGASGTAGPVTGESAGGLRVSYAFLQWRGHSFLASTRYGQMYLDFLGMSVAAGPWVV